MLIEPNMLPKFTQSFSNNSASNTTLGQSLTAGAANTKGSWSSIMAPVSFDLYFLHFYFSDGSTSATARSHLVDIGIDLSGGTSYTVFIANLLVGPAVSSAGCGPSCYSFPLFVPRGARLAARVQCNVASATLTIGLDAFGGLSVPQEFVYGTSVETLGANTANSRGTAYTAASNWYDFSPTYPWLSCDFGLSIANAAMISDQLTVDLAGLSFESYYRGKAYVSRTTEDMIEIIPSLNLKPLTTYIAKFTAGGSYRLNINYSGAFMSGGSVAVYGVY